MYKVPEKYRQTLRNTPFESKEGDMQGIFFIPLADKGLILYCLATAGGQGIDWEHVSVSVKKLIPKKNKMIELGRCPTWEEMCKVKDLFWDKTDTVVQFHPPESEYVSQHHHCLHLWRKCGKDFETPPSIAVGYTKGQKTD